jgi:NADH-quinone oxidoreductase subunit J
VRLVTEEILVISSPGVVIMFWLLSLVSVLGALGVVFARSLIHAVLFLIVVFLSMAGLFLTLSADFIAVSQVLIYVGAVSILMIFAIMLTPNATMANRAGPYRIPALIIAALFAVGVAAVALGTNWSIADRAPFATTAAEIGGAMLVRYVLAFEAAGVLLTVALIGAVVLVREDDTP